MVDPFDSIVLPDLPDVAKAVEEEAKPAVKKKSKKRDHKPPVIFDASGRALELPKVDLDEVEAMACIGLSISQMADALGIPVQQFGKLAKNDPYVTEAIDRGNARGVKMVADALFANAMKGNVAAQIFTLKARGGWSDKQEIDVKTTHEVKMSFDDAVEALKAAGIDPSKI